MKKQLIKGHRELTMAELANVNRLKELETEVANFINELSETADLPDLCIARNNLQTGFMWASRAVSRPWSAWSEVD